MGSERLGDLYRIYCAGFVRARLGKIQFKEEDPAGILAERMPEGMFALALGVEDGSLSRNSLKDEAAFWGAVEGGAASPPVELLRDLSQVAAAVKAEPLGSWTSAAEVFARVARRASPDVVDAHAKRIFDLCAARAKAHNDSLEGK